MAADASPGTPDGGLLRGTWYLVPTAFDASGEVDLASQRRLIDAAISWGVDGLTVMGVMSEPTLLAEWERKTTLESIFDAVAGRIPVVVGCSAASAALAIQYIGHAKDLGAVAAMVAAPTLIRNVDLLPGYFSVLRRDGGLPLLLQDEPAATGVTIPASVLMACAAASGARSIKVEDPPTPSKIARLHAIDQSLVMFGGLGGIMALSELRAGAAGTMTGFAFPEAMRAVRRAVEQGRWDEAGAVFDRFLPLIVFEAQPQVGLLIRKEVLRRRGAIEHAFTRGIVNRIDSRTADELDEILARVRVVPSLERLTISGPAGAALSGPGGDRA